MPDQSNSPRDTKPIWQALSLAWELGYTISIPLVVLALAGRLVDKWLGTTPWLLLVGVLVSIIISTWLVYRKTKTILSPSTSSVFDEEKNNQENNSGNK